MATIFAWTGALRKRGELDGNEDLVSFANRLEKASLQTIEDGVMTKDLAMLTDLKEVKTVNTYEFIKEIRNRLQ